VAVLAADGALVRHLAAGMLGPNAPAPFKKDSLAQEILWDGKDDLGVPTRTTPGESKGPSKISLPPAWTIVTS
jgi:hypothetical protein